MIFRGPQFQRDEKFNFKLTPEGWKVVIGAGLISTLEKKLAGWPPPAP